MAEVKPPRESLVKYENPIESLVSGDASRKKKA